MILASDWIAFHADRTPEKLALIDQHTGRRFTYGDFNDRAARLAAFLRDTWDVQPGDRVAIYAKNCSEYFEFEFACIKLGALMLPLNWRLAEPELLFILNDSGAKGIVYDADFAEKIPALVAGSGAKQALCIQPSPPAPLPKGERGEGCVSYEEALAATNEGVVMKPQTTHDTPLTIMYTAGTTGHPKGVLITHGMTLWNAVNISVPTGLSHESLHYVVLPTFHTGGLNLYANPCFHLGGTVIVARQFEPELTLNTITDPALGVTHFFGVPSIYLFLSQHPDFDQYDLRHIKSWGCGGAPMPVALLEWYARRGIVVQLGFGMTETSPTVFLIDKRRALEKPASVGKPLPHTRVRVVDDDLNDVPPGVVGEVVICGPNVTPGYWNRPEANATSFTLDEHGNRWLHSGDAGMIDEEGCIYIVDRYKDMYISGGENVYPAEVEQVLYQLEGVAEAAVIGVPDERWGECGLAILVLRPGAELREEVVLEHCRANLAKFKVPKSVAYLDVLPRNAAGKVLKRDLKAQFVPQVKS
ncbi:MAG: long-chain fatty acid--CoA ligase [bacterium]|nr:long-chain fatty acid--CoA ligase [bacterium]